MEPWLNSDQWHDCWPVVTLKVICNDFHKMDEKVVSSCLLQYKPDYVTNFDKLRRKMLKRRSFIGLFSIAV